MVQKKAAGGLRPTHPGEILREELLPAIGRSKTEIAEALGISRRMLYDLLEERKPVTAQMALRIGRMTSTRPGHWLDLQSAYDLHQAAAAMPKATLARIPVLYERFAAEE